MGSEVNAPDALCEQQQTVNNNLKQLQSVTLATRGQETLRVFPLSFTLTETSSVREKLHSEQDPDHRGLTAAGTCCSFSATFSALLGGFGEFVKRKKRIRVQTLEAAPGALTAHSRSWRSFRRPRSAPGPAEAPEDG
ncbi:Monocarboxylate transporter 12 [Dissostichus eleginoides]|uniref:Monocarboxylate transporter 12 n=1 Tax=Dissostichus eleginoides TaxID=100907 RepID=A0AAD9B281_DISEL|nr:Monocarboxylate transporter 12 [Dissostichus eleginoides]